MSFADEDRSSYDSVHRAQKRQRALLKLGGYGGPRQGEIVEAKRLAQADLAQSPVHRVGIGKRPAFLRNRDVYLLFGNAERQLQNDGSAQVHGFRQELETIPRHL